MSEATDVMRAVKEHIGEQQENIYVKTGIATDFRAPMTELRVPASYWSKGGVQNQRLYTEGKIFESLLPHLSNVQAPTLLLRGKYDPVTTDVEATAFANQVQNGQTFLFENSGHAMFAEEPELFADAVINFVLDR